MTRTGRERCIARCEWCRNVSTLLRQTYFRAPDTFTLTWAKGVEGLQRRISHHGICVVMRWGKDLQRGKEMQRGRWIAC